MRTSSEPALTAACDEGEDSVLEPLIPEQLKQDVFCSSFGHCTGIN
ncbi:MAG: hypothetical protein ACRCYY_15870 [Trueperaceae bacterium]